MGIDVMDPRRGLDANRLTSSNRSNDCSGGGVENWYDRNERGDPGGDEAPERLARAEARGERAATSVRWRREEKKRTDGAGA
jgi:hypothetical protein